MPCTSMARPKPKPKVEKAIAETSERVTREFVRRRLEREEQAVRAEGEKLARQAERLFTEGQAQMLDAQRELAARVLDVAREQARVAEQVAGVRVDVANLERAVASLTSLIESVSGEARRDRARITQAVDVCRARLAETRQALAQQVQLVRDGVATVLGRIDDLGRRQEVEQMAESGELISRAAMAVADFPTADLERFAGPEYAAARAQLDQARELHRDRKFAASLRIATSALDALGAVAANVRAAKEAFEEERRLGLESLSRLDGMLASLEVEVAQAWCGPAIAALRSERVALEPLLQADTTDSYRQLKDRADDLQHRAMEVAATVEQRLRQHEARACLVRELVRATAALGYRLQRPVLEDERDPNSDLLLLTDEGFTVCVSIEGEVVVSFADPADARGNHERLHRFSDVLQGADLTGFEVQFEHVPHETMQRVGPYGVRKPAEMARRRGARR